MRVLQIIAGTPLTAIKEWFRIKRNELCIFSREPILPLPVNLERWQGTSAASRTRQFGSASVPRHHIEIAIVKFFFKTERTDEMNSSTTPADDAIADTKKAASDMAANVRSSAEKLAGDLSGEATRAAHHAQDTAADEVKSVASALRTAADELRSGSPQERTFGQLADGLADASDALREKDLGEMMGELNRFARANPVVFLGGAALLGFVATRFAKAGTGSDNGQYSGNRTDGACPGQATSRGAQGGASGTHDAASATATPSSAPSSAAFRATNAGTGNVPDPASGAAAATGATVKGAK
jgi:hypothetical protein